MNDENPVTAVDLFCGGGGLSTGLAKACEDLDRDVELVAVNHDTTAIETHKRNHPWARHLNAKVEELHPPDVVKPGDVDILVAAPECTHFSTARGGMPVNEQKRASPMHVLDWVGKVQPRTMLLENVPEFKSWGPIVDGEPTRDGSKFEAWKHQLEADRYSVVHETLNAADYGDATSRRRFFVMARRDYRPSFPQQTHSEDGHGGTEEWRPAAEIIDWSDAGGSIWTRSRPLSNNTMQRIAEGIRQHCDDRLEPFADEVADITPADVESMQEDVVPVDALPEAAEERTEPFLAEGPAVGGDDSTTTMVMGQHSNAQAKDATEDPVPTVATAGAIHCIHADPFVLPRNGAFRGLHSNSTYEPDDRPLHTVTAKNHDGHLVHPFMLRYSHSGALLDANEPLPTVTTARCGDFALARPFLVEYYGNSDSASLGEPLPTVTTKDRHALIVPECYPWGLDLRYRMLQPRELAAAQGFPPDYDFAGNKTETTKQIGNAVPVNLGKALCKQLLLPNGQPTIEQYEQDPTVAADGGTAEMD